MSVDLCHSIKSSVLIDVDWQKSSKCGHAFTVSHLTKLRLNFCEPYYKYINLLGDYIEK